MRCARRQGEAKKEAAQVGRLAARTRWRGCISAVRRATSSTGNSATCPSSCPTTQASRSRSCRTGARHDVVQHAARPKLGPSLAARLGNHLRAQSAGQCVCVLPQPVSLSFVCRTVCVRVPSPSCCTDWSSHAHDKSRCALQGFSSFVTQFDTELPGGQSTSRADCAAVVVLVVPSRLPPSGPCRARLYLKEKEFRSVQKHGEGPFTVIAPARRLRARRLEIKLMGPVTTHDVWTARCFRDWSSRCTV